MTGEYDVNGADCTQSPLRDMGVWVVTRTVSGPQFDFTSALRIAQIADGGNFVTEFAIVNMAQSQVSYQFRFWDDNGNVLNLPIQAGTLTGTLLAGATSFVQTTGASAPALQGWAEVASTGPIGVLTIFKRSVAGSSDSEATVTGLPSSGSIFLPFDNTQGFITGVAVANTSAAQAITIAMVFDFEDGSQSTASITLLSHSHMAFVLPTTYPITMGARGSIHFTAPSPDVSVLGLRFNPNNSFTSLGSFQ
jgi:hypothetical protein